MIREDICHDEYHQIRAASAGNLKYFVEPSKPGHTPAHWVYRQEHPPEPTPALWDGRHTHCRILEPP